MKFKELQNKSQEELLKSLKEGRRKLLELRFGAKVNKNKDISGVRKIRKEIAQTLTALRKF